MTKAQSPIGRDCRRAPDRRLGSDFAQRHAPVYLCSDERARRDIADFVSEAQQRIEKEVKLPPGYYLKWGGTFENLQQVTNRLLIIVPIALFLIFILLYTTFGSAKQALLIYTGIPFAIVGGIITSTLLNLLILPTLYAWFEREGVID